MSEANPVHVQVPAGGEKITITNGKLHVPDQPIIPFIEGDGTGRDIWRASVRVFDAAVHKAYGGRRKIHWMEIFAGEKANKAYNTGINDAAKYPMEVIDFLQMKVDPAPGSAYLPTAFQVTTTTDGTPGPLAGSQALADVAYKAFTLAIAGEDDSKIPSLFQGVPAIMLEHVRSMVLSSKVRGPSCTASSLRTI